MKDPAKGTVTSHERVRTGSINSCLRACPGLIRRRWAIMILFPLIIAAVSSQSGAQQMPGMPFIAQKAAQAQTLIQILTGQTPATIPQYLTMPDSTGQISTYQPLAPLGGTQTAGNGFFLSQTTTNGTTTNITANGRTCFTCHRPQSDWEINPSDIQAEYLKSQGKSALFQPIDSAVCPNAPGATASYPDPRFQSARSMLFKRGLFRIALNAPNPLGPKNDGSYTTFDGNTSPEWVMTVQYDPYGCETDPVYGLPSNQTSVYRRPLNAANLSFLHRFDSVIEGPNGSPVSAPPGTYLGDPNQERQDIMWDAREPNLATQFIDATMFHGQTTLEPPVDIIEQGMQFQSGMFTGQTYDHVAGDLTGNDSSGARGGPINLYNFYQTLTPHPPPFPGVIGANSCSYSLNDQTNTTVLQCGPYFTPGQPSHFFSASSSLYNAFATPSTSNPALNAMRQSIARGEAIFNGKTKQFTIFNVAGLNDGALGNPIGAQNPRVGANVSCTFCHANANVMNDGASDPKRLGIMDNSNKSNNNFVVNTMAPTPDFPQFAFYCPTGKITFFSNPVTSPNCPGSTPGNPATCDEFITTDPGMGLITGKCADLGRMKVPILRGVGARAPYFHGGQAATLLDVVNFYDNRFNIGLTTQQKLDLINYLNSL